MTKAVLPADVVLARTITASFQFLLFNDTPLFLEATVGNVGNTEKTPNLNAF